MATCVRAVQQSDGAYALMLDPSKTDVSTCTYTIATGGEAASGSLLALSPSDAFAISGAVLLLWVTAWVFRQVSRSIVGESHAQDE